MAVQGPTIFATSRWQLSDTKDYTEGRVFYYNIRTLLVVSPVNFCYHYPIIIPPASGIPHKKKKKIRGLIFAGIPVKRGNVFEPAPKKLVEKVRERSHLYPRVRNEL